MIDYGSWLQAAFPLILIKVDVPYLPVYKATFEDLKISTKIRPQLIHGSRLEIQAPVK